MTREARFRKIDWVFVTAGFVTTGVIMSLFTIAAFLVHAYESIR